MTDEAYGSLRDSGIKDATIANFQAAGLTAATAISAAVKAGVSQGAVAEMAAANLFSTEDDSVATVILYSLGFEDLDAIQILLDVQVPVYDLKNLFTNLFGVSSVYLTALPVSALRTIAADGFRGADFIAAMHLFYAGIEDPQNLKALVAVPNSGPGTKVVAARRLFPLDPTGIDPAAYCALSYSMHAESLSLQRTPSALVEATVLAALKAFENAAGDFSSAHYIATALFVDVCKKHDASKLLASITKASDVEVTAVVTQVASMRAEDINVTAARVQKLFP